MSTGIKIYKPSESLLALVADIKAVAKFDPGIIQVFEQATKIAAVNKLMESPEMADILDKLEGNPAGFQTDIAAKGEKYPPKERNMAVTQAMAQGARLVNKEFAIIRSNAFLGKNYYQRMLDELGHDGSFTESNNYRMLWWDTEIGEIKTNGPIATAETRVTYKVVDKRTGQEVEKTFVRTFQIKTHSTDTPDLWVGKFERRAWQKLLRYLSGVDFGDDNDEGGVSDRAGAVQPPPVGAMNLAKEKPVEAQKAQDAEFKEIVKPTSKPQTKPYGEMSPEEKRVETARVHAESQKAVNNPAPVAAVATTTPGKPELF
jgi:hypothetical protein